MYARKSYDLLHARASGGLAGVISLRKSAWRKKSE